jgi:hypothetical protein
LNLPIAADNAINAKLDIYVCIKYSLWVKCRHGGSPQGFSVVSPTSGSGIVIAGIAEQSQPSGYEISTQLSPSYCHKQPSEVTGSLQQINSRYRVNSPNGGLTNPLG